MNRDQRMQRISVLSRRLRWVVWIVAALMLVLMVALSAFVIAWGLGGAGGWQYRIGGARVPAEILSPAQRAAFVLLLVPMFVVVPWLLWSWDRLLALYQRGVIFSPANAAIIRRCGQLIIAIGVLDTAASPIAALVLASLPAEIDVAFEPNLGLVIIGVAIIVVGHVMSLGAEMAEEASLTI